MTKEPKLPLNDNFAGKAEGRLGNSIGDRQMLEYIKAGDGAPSGAARRSDRESQKIYPFRDEHRGLCIGAILIAALSRLTQSL